MSKRLLTCECGRAVPVELGQAGGRALCACGATLQVPTLRRLRELPVATDQPVAETSAWRPQFGAAAGAVLIAAIAALASLGIRITEPNVREFDLAAMKRAVGQIEELRPVELWQWWVFNQHLPERGFPVYQESLSTSQEKQLRQKRLLEKILLGVAGIAVLSAACIAFLPAGNAGRTEKKQAAT
jgi:hypothetical protein